MIQLPHDFKTNTSDFTGNYGAMYGEGRLGHRIGGSRSGPVVIVHGHSPHARKVFERLLALPGLPFLRDHLYLVYQDQMPEGAENAMRLRESIVERDARFTQPPDANANQHNAPTRRRKTMPTGKPWPYAPPRDDQQSRRSLQRLS